MPYRHGDAAGRFRNVPLRDAIFPRDGSTHRWVRRIEEERGWRLVQFVGGDLRLKWACEALQVWHDNGLPALQNETPLRPAG